MHRYTALALLAAGFSVAAQGHAAGGPRSITVEADEVVGFIRSLQGAHFDPGPAGLALSRTYVDLGIDVLRTHDAGLAANSGVGDVDGAGSDRIFPNWDADPSDPASYNFGPTDALLRNIRATGAEVFFRVGRSATFMPGFPNSAVPPDFDKYAEVVKHIVLHYNKGWASGAHYGIRYFEIWNEPDFVPFWSGTAQQFYELYAKVACGIKSADRRALIGGPAITTFNDYTGMRESFLGYVSEHSAPLDFFSFHKYTDKSNDPFDYARVATFYRGLLDDYGFRDTRLVNSEYGYSLAGDPVIGGDAGKAAFAAAAQIYMQEAPVDLATSYMPISSPPSKENLGFKAVSMLNATPWRLAVTGADDTGFAVMSGTNPLRRELRVVIVNYEISPLLMGPIPGGNDVSIDIPGLGHLGTVTLLDRRTITYQDTEGYDLKISGIPARWGNLTIRQYRVDASSDLALVSSRAVARTSRGRELQVSGAWAHAPAAPPADPVGVAQGVDVIVVQGDGRPL